MASANPTKKKREISPRSLFILTFIELSIVAVVALVGRYGFGWDVNDWFIFTLVIPVL